MKVLKYLVAVLLCTECLSQSAMAAELTFKIEMVRVESRALFGGLGNTSESLGNVTEFFVPEIRSPLVSIAGDKTSLFKGVLFVYRENRYFLCPSAEFGKVCFECEECANDKVFESLRKFDVKNVGTIRQKVFKNMGTAATSVNGQINVDFIFPIKNSKPLELRVKTDKFGDKADVLIPFRHKNYIVSLFKSESDANYYICPGEKFSQSCLVCDNCLLSLEKIRNYHPMP